MHSDGRTVVARSEYGPGRQKNVEPVDLQCAEPQMRRCTLLYRSDMMTAMAFI